MIVSKTSHREIRMIVSILPPHIHLPLPLGGLHKVLRQELALFVKIVRGTLSRNLVVSSTPSPAPRDDRKKTEQESQQAAKPHKPARNHKEKRREHTTSIKTSNSPPSHLPTNSHASYSFHSPLSSPRYPLNAFSPHGHFIGFAIGANALTLRYLPGFFRNSVSAPWPPIL